MFWLGKDSTPDMDPQGGIKQGITKTGKTFGAITESGITKTVTTNGDIAATVFTMKNMTQAFTSSNTMTFQVIANRGMTGLDTAFFGQITARGSFLRLLKSLAKRYLLAQF